MRSPTTPVKGSHGGENSPQYKTNKVASPVHSNHVRFVITDMFRALR